MNLTGLSVIRLCNGRFTGTKRSGRNNEVTVRRRSTVSCHVVFKRERRFNEHEFKIKPTHAAAFAICLHTYHEVVNERSHQFATTRTKCTRINDVAN